MSCVPDHHHYLPVDDDAMRWGLYLTGAGCGVIPAGQPYPQASHPRLYDFTWQRGRTLPEFQLALFTEGGGVFESKPTGVTPIASGTLLFLFPGTWHRYRPDRETGWTERWISFNGELAHRLLDQRLVHPESAVGQVSRPSVLQRLFDDLLQRIHRQPDQNSILLSMHAMALLAAAIESVNDSPTEAEVVASPSAKEADRLVSRAVEIIWTRSHQPLSVPEIARQLGVHRRRLERCFRQERGHTVLEEIQLCRFSRAKRLVVETDLPIKAISHLAGFTSIERMRIAFVEREGASPASYRTRCGNSDK